MAHYRTRVNFKGNVIKNISVEVILITAAVRD